MSESLLLPDGRTDGQTTATGGSLLLTARARNANAGTGLA